MLTGYRLFFMPVLSFNSRENSNSQWLSFQSRSDRPSSEKQREQKLDADQKVVAQDQNNIADAALFLG
jgi:hypothetical protein